MKGINPWTAPSRELTSQAPPHRVVSHNRGKRQWLISTTSICPQNNFRNNLELSRRYLPEVIPLFLWSCGGACIFFVCNQPLLDDFHQLFLDVIIIGVVSHTTCKVYRHRGNVEQ